MNALRATITATLLAAAFTLTGCGEPDDPTSTNTTPSEHVAAAEEFVQLLRQFHSQLASVTDEPSAIAIRPQLEITLERLHANQQRQEALGVLTAEQQEEMTENLDAEEFKYLIENVAAHGRRIADNPVLNAHLLDLGESTFMPSAGQ